ncbi:MAG: AAA family ATPase [Rectinemataceae bacterium]
MTTSVYTFSNLVEGVFVVILIDEYDKPILGHLGTSSVLAIQEELKKFYSVVKKTEALQRFALITGVSTFSKVSIFSDLNNLADLTMNAQAATLLGYTQTELEANFPEYLEALATATGRTRPPDAGSDADLVQGLQIPS